MEDLTASMAVSIPTRAIIPKAIMNIVIMVLSLLVIIAWKDIRKFSQNKRPNLIMFPIILNDRIKLIKALRPDNNKNN